MEKNQIKNKENPDPFYSLKYIAWCISQLPPEDVGVTEEDFANYAKWVICKKKNKLYYDPIWDHYGPEELMIEYFGLLMDDNEEFKDAFSATLKKVKAEDLNWFDAMEKKFLEEQRIELKEKTGGKDEFEDKF